MLHRARGAGYLTFTLLHEPGAHPRQSLDALLATWVRAFSAGSWLGDYRARPGMIGWARSVESTFPAAGAHPHLHTIFLHRRPPSTREVDALRSRWVAVAIAIGYTAVLRAQDAQHIHSVERRNLVAFYLTEQNTIRQSRAGKGRTPGDLLHSVALTGDADDLAMLFTFHVATRGRRKIATSRGFDDLLKER